MISKFNGTSTPNGPYSAKTSELHSVRAFTIRSSLNKMSDKTWYPGCTTWRPLSCTPLINNDMLLAHTLFVPSKLRYRSYVWGLIQNISSTCCSWKSFKSLDSTCNFSNHMSKHVQVLISNHKLSAHIWIAGNCNFLVYEWGLIQNISSVCCSW